MATTDEPTTPTTTDAPAPTAPAFKLTTTPAKVLAEYLKAHASADADAPHRGLPFIDGKENVRVKPDHFAEWFLGAELHEGTPTTREVRAVLKDAGLVQKVYALPTVEGQDDLKGKSFGLYTGPAPQGTKTLPHRVVERKAPALRAAADTMQTPEPSDDGVEQVEAKTLQVGDVIATSRKAILDGKGETIAAITADKDSGKRVQARRADGKMIRSFEPTTKTWRGRTTPEVTPAA
jgi:hypothetical protein